MKASHRGIAAITCSMLAITAATPALAQTSGEGATGADIVVTARRVEERLQDVPISISVYNQEQLSERNIVNAADLGTYTPSLSTNAQYGPEKATFVIRGFVQDFGTAPSVGVYFADVVAPQAAGFTPGGNGVGVGAMFDLQNVQVLKGPQGTLFGRNTTGGAVLMVPRRPTDELEGYFEASAGSYAMRRMQAVLNLPLAETFKVRLGMDRMTRDGYLRNHSGLGPSAFADTDYIALRGSVLADLTPDLENYTIATFSHSKNNGSLRRIAACMTQPMTAQQGIGAFYGCAQLARQEARGDGFWDVENSHPNPGLNIRQWQLINTTTWDASDTLTVKNIASYGEFREVLRQAFGGDNFLNPFTGSTTPDLVFSNFDVLPGRAGASQSTFTEELQLQGRSGSGKLTWQAGGYMEISNPVGTGGTYTPIFIYCADYFAYACAGQGYVRSTQDQFWFRSHALYGQATYNFTEQLSLTAGLRYTWDKTRQSNSIISILFPQPNVPLAICGNTARITNPDGSVPVFTTPTNFDPCRLEFSAKSSKPTWVIDLDYKPLPDVMLYAKWARGYRKGGVAALNPFFETWQPEKVDMFELGAKTSFHGAVSGYFNISAFYNDFRNQQIQTAMVTADPSRFVGGSAVLNAGRSRIMGIEVDASARLRQGLQIDVGYAYLDTKLKQLDVPSIPEEAQDLVAMLIPSAVEGGVLAYSPKHRLTVTGSYTLPLDESIGRIRFGATYTYTSSQVASNGTAPQFIPLTARKLLNLNASWDNVAGQPIDLAFFMTNATNRDYVLSVSQSWGALGFESVVPNEPRMWGLRLRYRFGE